MAKVLQSCLLFFAVAAVLLGGCVATAPPQGPLFYPPAPEEPKIVYLRSISSELDFRKPSFLDLIFGVPSGSVFRKPYGVSAHDDKIYVADTPNSVVFVIDMKREEVSFFGPSQQGGLVAPIGVAAGADGTIYVTDSSQEKVFAYDTKGNIKFVIGKKDEFKNLGTLAVNNELGRLYVVDTFGHTVRVYSLKGEPLFQFGTEGFEDGEFHYPTNVAVDKKTGNVYVTDTQNFRVEVFDKDGKFLKRFGSLGDQPGAFSRPKGIGIDSEGNVYVADAAFDNFQVFNKEGRLLIDVGGPGNAPGMFLLPAGLCVDENDRIYVVDSVNKRVDVFQYLSEGWKKAHPEEYRKYLQQANAGAEQRPEGKGQ